MTGRILQGACNFPLQSWLVSKKKGAHASANLYFAYDGLNFQQRK
jgi:hypothetical protein